MSLGHLLDVLSGDPGVARARRRPARGAHRRRGRRGGRAPGAAGRAGPLRAAGTHQAAARRDCHRRGRPRTSAPPCAASSTPTRSPTSRPGRRCPTSGSARAATPSAGASPCCAGSPPRPDDPAYGPLDVVVAPVRAVLQPVVKGSATCARSPCAPATRRPLEQVVAEPRGRRLHPHRPGRAARRVRRARRHPRRLPAHRGPPGPRRVLGRHRRGDPLVQGRRPAQPRGRRARPVGAALPGAAAHRRRARARRRPRRPAPGAADLLGKLAEGIAVEGMESLAPALVDGMEPLLDTCPRAPPWSCATPSASAPAPTTSSRPARSSSRPAGPTPPPATPCRSTCRASSAPRRSGASPTCAPTPARRACRGGPQPVHRRRRARRRRPPRARHRPHGGAALPRQHPDEALSDLRRWVAEGWRVVVVTEGHGLAKRVDEVLAEEEVPSRLDADLADLAPGVVHVTTGGSARLRRTGQPARRGHRDRPHRHPGRARSTKDMRRMPSRRRNQVDPLQLKPGDFVVHEQHGVGRFVEMVQRTVGGATPRVPRHRVRPRKRGQPGDRLFVPTDQLDQVTRTSAASSPPSTRWAAPDWPKTKASAPPLRQGDRGRADPALQRPHGDPRARLRPGHPVAARARGRLRLRRDPRPAEQHRRGQGRHGEAGPHGPPHLRRRRLRQDRDRGARRLQGRPGRQAGAVLVPTTLLVQQHFQTFSERYAQFPVVVPALSRFQSDKEAARSSTASPTAASTSSSARTACCPRTSGSRTSAWSSSTRSSASASSTRSSSRPCAPPSTCSPCPPRPIPRTLEMAVTGIREMSTLATPPEERPPGADLRRRLRREADHRRHPARAAREGQVFFVHNKVAASRRPRRASASWCPRPASPRPTGRWASTSSSRSCSTSGRSSSTCWSARRSSRRASTSPTPTP